MQVAATLQERCAHCCGSRVAAKRLIPNPLMWESIFHLLRFKSPKFSVRSGSFDNDTFQIGMESDAAPSFNLTMNTQFGVKNTDFGHFNYEMSTVTFEYRGTAVGMVSVDKARTRARTTRKFDAKLLLKTDSMADESFEQLGGDVSSGKVPLTSSSSFT
ncbi:hypothetical protein GH714_028560 [Hevea brasiliensis]|uniref:Late embryogenesis abundant protein LEA-2 subgroup domain-containing protein n=1 Tax=Hevea brasiliensis TaxID=3981 RepID=A0A6A6MG05_HEVBR|nr:hypothetical protein GH714_028560 [Hevea brasiliensis]